MARPSQLIGEVFAPRCSHAVVIAAALERATARRADTTLLVCSPDDADAAAAAPASARGEPRAPRVVRGHALGFQTSRNGSRRFVLAVDPADGGARSIPLDWIVSVMFHDGAHVSGLIF